MAAVAVRIMDQGDGGGDGVGSDGGGREGGQTHFSTSLLAASPPPTLFTRAALPALCLEYWSFGD